MANDELLRVVKKIDLHGSDTHIALDMIAYRLAVALGYNEEEHGLELMNLNALMQQVESRLGDWLVLFPQAEPGDV